MINQDKRNFAENAGPSLPPRGPVIHDPPPPYTLYKSPLNPKPPPPPYEPPALSREPLPGARPGINLGPEITDRSTPSVWESFKSVCCLAFCWPSIICMHCIDRCALIFPKANPGQNQ